MNWADYVILAVLLISALIGLSRGLIREVLSLAVWILALGGAWLYYRDLAEMLTPQISNPTARIAVAFVGVVLVILVLGAILGAILTAVVNKTRLNGLDRFLGFVFGAARGIVLVSMAVFLGALTPMPDEAWWQESRTIAQFRTASDWMLSLVPPGIQEQLRKV